MPDGSLGGPWNYTNAASFIGYTVNKGYAIHGWELGMLSVILWILLPHSLFLLCIVKALYLRYLFESKILFKHVEESGQVCQHRFR